MGAGRRRLPVPASPAACVSVRRRGLLFDGAAAAVVPLSVDGRVVRRPGWLDGLAAALGAQLGSCSLTGLQNTAYALPVLAGAVGNPPDVLQVAAQAQQMVDAAMAAADADQTEYAVA